MKHTVPIIMLYSLAFAVVLVAALVASSAPTIPILLTVVIAAALSLLLGPLEISNSENSTQKPLPMSPPTPSRNSQDGMIPASTVNTRNLPACLSSRVSARTLYGNMPTRSSTSILINNSMMSRTHGVPGLTSYRWGATSEENSAKKFGKDKKAPQETINQLSEEMRPLREAAFNASLPLKQLVIESGFQKALDLETRMKMRKKVKPL